MAKDESWAQPFLAGVALLVVLCFFEWLTIREERRYAEAVSKGDYQRADYHVERARIFAIFCLRKGSRMPERGEGI